ncbi:hypothetical protein GCM10009633_13930 [Janibacter melonis]|jgi:hypothetical protein
MGLSCGALGVEVLVLVDAGSGPLPQALAPTRRARPVAIAAHLMDGSC